MNIVNSLLFIQKNLRESFLNYFLHISLCLSEDTGDVNLNKCVSVAWQNPRPQWPLSHLAS